MIRRRALRNVLVAVAAALLCASAGAAGLFRAYVSSKGSDGNACTLPAPCRLLPAALAAVADGGEVWMLDSANYNTAQVEVTKSVTILAVPGAVGSVIVNGGGSALNVNTAGIKVVLRNLVIVPLGAGPDGVAFGHGAELNIEGCEIGNLGSGAAVDASAAGGLVNIKDSVLRDSSYGLFLGSGVTASLDRVRLENNAQAAVFLENARVTIKDSVLSGGATGIYLFENSQSVMEQTVVSGTTAAGINVVPLNPGDAAEATISRSVISHNAVGVQLNQSAGMTAQAIVDASSITHNGQGINFVNSGSIPTVYSRGNNTVKFNTQDFNGTGAAFTAQAGR